MIKLECEKRLDGINGEFTLNAKANIVSGEFVALYGNSGSGKTTILRLLSGFENPDRGSIIVNGTTFFNSKDKINIPPQKRNIGFLFQDYALFEHMSVIENLLYAKNDNKLATHLLEILDLGALKNKSPKNLSGGQAQRVALARALMRKPNILLLDEPLSALDAQMREKLQEYLLSLHSEFKFTCILISHDIAEIYKLCSRVLKIENGTLQSKDTTSAFLNTSSSHKLSLYGKILNLKKDDTAIVALILIGQRLSKIILSQLEAQGLKVGDNVQISAKSFGMSIRKI